MTMLSRTRFVAFALALVAPACGPGPDATSDASIADVGTDSLADVPDGSMDAQRDSTSDAPDAFTTCTNDAGHTCPAGHSCADENGTNYCGCTESNRDLSVCTALDAGTVQVECQTTADCTARGKAVCLFFQGCGPGLGRCVYAQYIDPVSEAMCGCDGVTYTGGVDRPYAHAGACP